MQRKNKPNIVFIMSDDHAAHVMIMSLHDSMNDQTPILDPIAEERIRFDHAFCTNYTCAPSRATILTGR